METVEKDRLNLLAAVALAAILLAGLFHIVNPMREVLMFGMLIAILFGSLAIMNGKPGKELGFVAIALSLVGLVTL